MADPGVTTLIAEAIDSIRFETGDSWSAPAETWLAELAVLGAFAYGVYQAGRSATGTYEWLAEGFARLHGPHGSIESYLDGCRSLRAAIRLRGDLGADDYDRLTTSIDRYTTGLFPDGLPRGWPDPADIAC